MTDTLQIDGKTLQSRFFLGTATYPSPKVLQEAIDAAQADVVTVGLKRFLPGSANPLTQSTTDGVDNQFFAMLKASGRQLLPNTAGCKTATEAITLANMAREIFGTHWIKLEVIGDDYTLQPDPFALVEAARELIQQGFFVFPYCTDDLVTCNRLLDVGCQILMPWGAPIGSGQGLINTYALKTLRARLPEVPLVVDAGIGSPMHAVLAMQMGFDAVLLNSAVAQSHDPVRMAEAFKLAIQAGRLAYHSGVMAQQEMAVPSTQVTGRPFML
ncbi:thiazole synthase [Brackiella oedipodis]|uniref:thiazole synthase n=1 Tax=Brackiella oedipodis TaxID=124225 RepID=UPI00048FFF03|nr:thiazole synthase [Brackiella oedipodis]